MRKIACFAVMLGLSFVAGQSRADGWAGTKEVDDKEAAARGDVTYPDTTAPFASWKASQQWMPKHGHDSDPRSQYGYGNLSGMLLLADELGAKLSETGRASLVAKCFDNADANASSTLLWALCGSDAQAVDLKKVEAELTADHVKNPARADILKEAAEAQAAALKIGDAIAAAAKNDPGLQKYLKLTADAKAEWSAYIGTNKAAFDRYLALKDAVRSGKSNDPGFAGCFDATSAPFAKIVKATAPKIPWDVGNDQLPGYMKYLVATPEGYIATVSWAACAWSIDKSGEAPYAASANEDYGGNFRAGWRTLALSKYLAKDLPEPKFADRSLSTRNWVFQWQYGAKMSGINEITAIQTPSMAEIAKLTPKDDMVTIRFKGDKVEECLQWYDPGLGRDKICKKRGMVDNDEGSVDVPAKYMRAKVGDKITIIDSFPVVSWKGKKLTSLLGVAL